YTPVGGRIVEVNDALRDKPELLNSSPLDQGWLYRIEMSDPSEVDALLDATAYDASHDCRPRVMASLQNLQQRDAFPRPHIGPNEVQVADMLKMLGCASLDALIEQTVPAAIALKGPLELPEPESEHDALARLRRTLAGDRPGRSFIGLGYYDTLTPYVIQRN